MEDFIINFFHTHKTLFETLSYLIVFLGGILESIPLFGFIVPGQTIVILAGVLGKLNAVSIPLITLTAWLAVNIGDLISYLLGKKYGEGLLKKYKDYILITESQYLKTKTLLNEHPGKSIILGRFHPLTRSLAAFIAGTSGIPFTKFIRFSILGSFIWVISFISLGFVIGEGFETFAKMLGKFSVFATLIAILAISFIQYAKNNGYKFKKKDANLFILNIIFLFIFVVFGEITTKGNILNFIDQFGIHITQKLQSNFFLTLSLFFANLEPEHLIGISALLSAFLCLKGKIKHALFVFGTMSFGAIATYLTKILFMRPRPEFSMIPETGNSFPSGHATIGFLFISILYVIIKGKLTCVQKILFLTLGSLSIVAISISRVYLGVHYMTDVIGGCILGLWCITSGVIVLRFSPWIWYKINRKHTVPNL